MRDDINRWAGHIILQRRHIPNIITSSRIVVAGLFPFSPESWHVALIVFALVSEFLDGLIARIFNWVSYAGQLLDPIADKLFVLSVSVTWIVMGKLALWQWLLLTVRDFGVLIIFTLMFLGGKLFSVRAVKAQLPSKITTAIQYAAFFAILLNFLPSVTYLAWMAAILGAVAVIQYAFLLRQAYVVVR